MRHFHVSKTLNLDQIKSFSTTSSNIKTSLILITVLLILNPIHTFHLQSKTKTEQQYKASFIPSQDLYSISLQRTASSHESESPVCRINNKQIVVKNQREIYRLAQTSSQGQKNRQMTIFQQITTLDDDQNIIEEFELVGNETFVVTTQGKGYFLQPKTDQIIEVNTGLNLAPSSTNQFFNILIKDFKQRSLIITLNQVVLCRSDQKSCIPIEPYQKVNYLFSAQIYTVDAITYLFLMTGDSVVVYEISAGNQLKNREEYGSQFFGVDRVHIRSIVRSKQNELLFLDSRRGIVSVTYEGKMSNFKTQKLIYDQPGCYQFSGNKQGDQIVLTCTLAAKSFFLQKLIRSYTFAQPHYEVLQTIFTNQKIYDTAFVDNFIMSRVYSGVRLYWTSNSLATPYPYDYNSAGSIFLHNALQSKLKVLESGQNIIYISTEDQIRQFSLRAIDPYVWCYSLQQVSQSYNVKYSFPCSNPTPLQKICQSQQQLTYASWQHGQVKVTTMLIPLIICFIGVLLIVFILVKVYRKYNDDIQKARLRYNTENEFGM